MDFSTFHSIVNVLYLLLIAYLLTKSQITRDDQLRVPFWILIILIIPISAWMKWDHPYLRLALLAVCSLGICFIYYLSFRKRIKTTLDYLKMVWIILFFIDTMTIQTMRSLLLQGYDNWFVNAQLIFRLDKLFDLFLMLYLLVIAWMSYHNEKKLKQLYQKYGNPE